MLIFLMIISTSIIGCVGTPPPRKAGWTLYKGDDSDGGAENRGVFQVGDPAVQPGGRTWFAQQGGRDLLWVFGGRNTDGVLQSTMYVYWAQAEWAWVQGDQPSVAFQPVAREGATLTYITNHSDLILHGGLTDRGFSNEMFQFNYDTFSFSLISGSSTLMNLKTTKDGPGGRAFHNTEDDFGDLLYIFGGYGIDDRGNLGLLSDLWAFHQKSKTWSLQSGSMTRDQRSVYSGAGSAPGARRDAVSWLDHVDGDFYVGFGQGFDGDVGKGLLKDLWVFRVKTKAWEFLSGEQVINRPGTYGGALGKYDATFHPGSRRSAGSAYDAAKTRLLMGFGYGYAGTSESGQLNDLWAFDVASKQWTMLDGTIGVNQRSTKDQPAGRSGCGFAFRVDLQIFGGVGVTHDAKTGGDNSSGILSDVWQWLEPAAASGYTADTLWPTRAPTAPTPAPTTAAPVHPAAVAVPLVVAGVVLVFALLCLRRICKRKKSLRQFHNRKEDSENLDRYLDMN